MMRWNPISLLVLCVAGCGTVSSSMQDANEGSSDAPVADDNPDGKPPRCNKSAPFQSPVKVSELNTAASDEGGYLTPDELTIYFDSTRAPSQGLYDIVVATRANRTDMFGNVTAVAGVNDAGHQRRPNVTEDGLTLFAMIGSAPNYELAIATRANTSDAFGALAPIAEINSTTNDEPGSILPDGSVIYFGSDRSGNGNYDLYRSSRGPNGVFGPPLPVSGVDLNLPDSEESSPVITADELTLFFASNRAGESGGGDIYMATRTSTADGFGEPINLQTINTAMSDVPQWVSPDSCVLYIFGGPCCSYDISYAMRGM